MKYHLSRTQHKRLRRGDTLQIAIPAWTYRDDETPLQLTRRVLDTGAGAIVSAEEAAVWVNPLERAGGSLTETLGEIVDDTHRRTANRWLIQVQVLIATVCVASGGEQWAPAWPKYVVLGDGQEIPAR